MLAISQSHIKGQLQKFQNVKIGLFQLRITDNLKRFEGVKEITPAVVAIIPTMGTGEGRPRIGPQTR